MQRSYEEILRLLGNPNLGELSPRDKAFFVEGSNRLLAEWGEEKFVRMKAYLLDNWDYALSLYGQPVKQCQQPVDLGTPHLT